MGLGERIKLARDRLGWTQGKLAQEVGSTRPSTVGDWEDGGTPSAKYLEELPKALGVSGHWLITGEGPMEPVGESEAQVRLSAVRDAVAAPIDSLKARVSRSAEGADPEVAARAADAVRKSPPRKKGRSA